MLFAENSPLSLRRTLWNEELLAMVNAIVQRSSVQEKEGQGYDIWRGKKGINEWNIEERLNRYDAEIERMGLIFLL